MRVVIVTGVSRGLGAALARALLDKGLTVLGVGRSSAPGLEGDRYRFADCDLADVAGIDAALSPAFGALAGLAPRWACLVNNAATTEPLGVTSRHDGAAIMRSLAVNLGAPIALGALFLRAFPDAAVERTIVNVSSGAARAAIAGSGLYCESKAGLEMLTRHRHRHADARARAIRGRVPVGRDVPQVPRGPAPRRARRRRGEDRRQGDPRQAPQRRGLRVAGAREAPHGGVKPRAHPSRRRTQAEGVGRAW